MIEKKYLQPGDILLYKPRKTLFGYFVVWAENVIGKNPLQGQVKVGYCHVALVDYDTAYILEARWPKSRRWKLDWKLLDSSYTVELWRFKNISILDTKKMLDWAHNNLNQWYDIGLFFWGWMDRKHSEVCSTFVAKAAEAGNKIFVQEKPVGLGTLITPDELAGNSNLIEKVVL